MSDVKDWMVERIQEARELFGVGGADWHVRARLSDKPLGDAENDGSCQVDAVYLNATIELQPDMENNEAGRAIIYHEVLHVAHEEVDRAARAMMDRLPRKERKLLRKVYYEAVERFVQRTSRSVCAGVAPKEENHEIHEKHESGIITVEEGAK